jgi:putative hydrolase of HD superfamily
MITYKNKEFSDIDLLKVLKMILIHDIVEIDAGDNFVFSKKEQKEVTIKENKASERIFGLLPNELKIEFINLWNEFEERKTKEAKFAKAMDSIQPLINHLASTHENENPNKLTKSQIIKLKYKIRNESEYLWEITEYLINESVKKGLYSEEI